MMLSLPTSTIPVRGKSFQRQRIVQQLNKSKQKIVHFQKSFSFFFPSLYFFIWQDFWTYLDDFKSYFKFYTTLSKCKTLLVLLFYRSLCLYYSRGLIKIQYAIFTKVRGKNCANCPMRRRTERMFDSHLKKRGTILR